MVESYYLFASGDLRRKDNVVRLTTKDKRFKDIKVDVTRDIFLFGNVNTNTDCLNYLSQSKYLFICLIIMDIIQVVSIQKRLMSRGVY